MIGSWLNQKRRVRTHWAQGVGMWLKGSRSNELDSTRCITWAIVLFISDNLPVQTPLLFVFVISHRQYRLSIANGTQNQYSRCHGPCGQGLPESYCGAWLGLFDCIWCGGKRLRRRPLVGNPGADQRQRQCLPALSTSWSAEQAESKKACPARNAVASRASVSPQKIQQQY